MDAAGVDRAVLVGAQITHNESNNDYLFAAQHRWPGRFFVFPDHDSYWSPDSPVPSPERLSALREAHRIAGISLYLDDKEDARRLLERPLLWSYCASHGLALSLGMRPWHAAVVRELAQANPALTILAHHLGGMKARFALPLSEQLHHILSLVDCSNVYLKQSGLPYLGPASDWLLRAIEDAFGPARLCWGSNWPVTADSLQPPGAGTGDVLARLLKG